MPIIMFYEKWVKIILEKIIDIKKSEKTLGNASMMTGGAVPEPHEWMLIILGLVMASWLFFFKGKGW